MHLYQTHTFHHTIHHENIKFDRTKDKQTKMYLYQTHTFNHTIHFTLFQFVDKVLIIYSV